MSRPLQHFNSDRIVGKWRLLLVAGPVLLLALEVAILTPLVEFSSGWMAYLANPKLCSALFLGMVLFIMLSITDLLAALQHQPLKYAVFWLCVNLGVFYYLLHLSLALAGPQHREGIFWYQAVEWLVVVFFTGISAVLGFLPLSSLIAWMRQSWHKAVGVMILAINFVILVPEIQKTWNYTHPSTIGIAAEILESCGRNPVTGLERINNPILAIQGKGTRLTITRYCAEMESLATFLLLALILYLAHSSRIRFLPWLTIVLVGLFLLYFLNALRVALLVEIAGSWANPQLAVSLAHSRLSGIFFLGISLLLLVISRSWWCPSKSKEAVTEAEIPGR